MRYSLILTLALSIVGINLLLVSLGISWFEAVLLNMLMMYWTLLWILILEDDSG